MSDKEKGQKVVAAHNQIVQSRQQYGADDGKLWQAMELVYNFFERKMAQFTMQNENRSNEEKNTECRSDFF